MQTLESDCDAPNHSRESYNPQAICNYTSFLFFVKPLE
jgi:hypothetical protein